MKKHQLQAVVGIGRKKYPQKSCDCVRLIENVRRQIYLQHTKIFPCIKEIHEVPRQDEILTTLVSFHIRFYYHICSILVIIADYMNACVFNNSKKSSPKGDFENLIFGHKCEMFILYFSTADTNFIEYNLSSESDSL